MTNRLATLILLLIPLLPAITFGQKYEDPSFAAWNRWPIGSYAVFDVWTQDKNEKPVHGRLTLMLENKGDQSIDIFTQIWRLNADNIEVGDPVFSRFQFGQFMDKPAEVLADEEVQYKDRKLLCHVYRAYSSEAPESPMTVYTNDEVPGGLVKLVFKPAKGMPVAGTLTDFKFGTTDIENPVYTAWKKYNRFSYAVYESDPTDAKDATPRVRLIRKLEWIDKDKIEISSVKVPLFPDGKIGDATVRKITLNHFTAAPSIEKLADEDVTLDGRSYHCRVVRQTSFGEEDTDGTLTSWVNDKVPGGRVKSSFVQGNGTPVNLHLVLAHAAGPEEHFAPVPRASELTFDARRPGDLSLAIDAPPKWNAWQNGGTPGLLKAFVYDTYTGWERSAGLITVEKGMPVTGGIEAVARQIAGTDGSVSNKKLTVDGIEGLEVRTPSQGFGRPAVAAVFSRQSRMYVIAGFGPLGLVDAGWKGVIAKWQWSRIDTGGFFGPAGESGEWEKARTTTRPTLPPDPGREMMLRNAFRKGRVPATLPSISQSETETQVKAVQSTWQKAAGKVTELLPTMKGGTRDGLDVVVGQRESMTTLEAFRPPVTFRAVVFNAGTDLRFGFAANQVIFNWEMVPDELRVDGGPASGRHHPGAGTLPSGRWVGIEWTVTPTDMVLFVDGHEIYRENADFSKVNKPFSLISHTGTTRFRSISVVK